MATPAKNRCFAPIGHDDVEPNKAWALNVPAKDVQ